MAQALVEGILLGDYRFVKYKQATKKDEINQATPKSQSTLLEAMEEEQVTFEGETRALENPFFVIATQNPLEQQFPLDAKSLCNKGTRI